MALAINVCSSARVFTPEPSSALAAMAAKTAARLSGVRFGMPKADRLLSVSAGSGVRPAAKSNTPLTVCAKASSFSGVSTAVAL